KLAHLLVNYSIKLKKGESCLINAIDVPSSMVEYLIEEVYAVGAYPVVNVSTITIDRAMVKGSTQESLSHWATIDSYRMNNVDTFIGIRGIVNPRELASLTEQNQLYMKHYDTPVHHDIRIPHTRWVVLRYPTLLMAYQANLSFEEFTAFFYKVTTEVDYPKMRKAMEKAKIYLDQADMVHITGKGTDLSFSIKGMGSIVCAGEMNIPDGEIYTAPIKESVNGVITYNTPSTYNGHLFSDISFTIEKGKIVQATSDDTELLNKILDTDEGSRYFGEFALGCNPAILEPMDNTLFDEKIAGSFHFTPGMAYEDCDNTNRSSIHWDLVHIQRPEYGGGEIIIDNELIRKDGRFVHPSFTDLNFD
ncbi:MAG: aminopeptidase, partial [Sphaerochaetaceae bacterium]